MDYRKTKLSCYYAYLSMSSPFSLPPLLFITFHEMYGISYTLLGTLILINFCTQLAIDLIFSFFAKHFNIKNTVHFMPLLTSFGLLFYAFSPMIFPDHEYIGLAVGTVIFSVAAGLSEVLMSPLIASIPSQNPDRDMSRLHSLYAYGVLCVIIISTAYLKLFGTHNWMYLAMFFALLPVVSFILFSTSPMPKVVVSQPASGEAMKKKNIGLALFAACIFLGGAAENTMTNWISGFFEKALNISKSWGDVFGMAMFAVLLGVGRSLYARFGKNISNILLAGMIGSTVCYLIAGFSNSVVISVIACVLTGLCTSMLWPGTLIMMEEKLPNVGVVAYALMAAGGDFGGAVAPQLLGIVVDGVSKSGWAENIGKTLSMKPDQIGLKVGIITAAAFPLLGIAVIIILRRRFAKHKPTE